MLNEEIDTIHVACKNYKGILFTDKDGKTSLMITTTQRTKMTFLNSQEWIAIIMAIS